MKRTSNILLLFAVILPVVLLFWPFVQWSDAMALILRVIPSVAGQVLLLRIGNRCILKALPALLTGAFAAWGTYLFFTSPHWVNATAAGLITDYVSPFLCCIAVLLIRLLLKKRSRPINKGA